MMHTKKITALALALTLSASLMACGAKEEAPAAVELTAEQYTTIYTDAVNALDFEMVEYNPVMTEISAYDPYMLEMLGMTAEDMEAAGLSLSMMGVQAYGIALVKPAEGSEQVIVDGLNNYVALQQSNFEMYLADQYEIAEAGTVETLEDGTVLMVICEDGAAVRDQLVASVQTGIAHAQEQAK